MGYIGENRLSELLAKLKAAFVKNTDTVAAQAIDIDNAPTANSNNLVTSGGVYYGLYPSVESAQPVGGMLPNVPYNLGTLSGNTTFVFASPIDNTITNHYYFVFDTPSTAPTITWPAAITSWFGGSAPVINASKHYEISVLDGVGIAMEV